MISPTDDDGLHILEDEQLPQQTAIVPLSVARTLAGFRLARMRIEIGPPGLAWLSSDLYRTFLSDISDGEE